MAFSVQYRYGASEALDEVPDETIRRLLAELDEGEDVEHGDVWITDEASGWTMGAFAGGRRLIVLEDTNSGGESFHRIGVDREDAFALMRVLADGNVDTIREQSWSPGYGS